jgi:hypothetical protein
VAKHPKSKVRPKRRTGTKRRKTRAGRQPASGKGLVARGIGAPCLPKLQAARLVRQCAGRVFDASTKLGEVFTDVRREQFCTCVSSGSGVPRPRMACNASNSFSDVINSIAC